MELFTAILGSLGSVAAIIGGIFTYGSKVLDLKNTAAMQKQAQATTEQGELNASRLETENAATTGNVTDLQRG